MSRYDSIIDLPHHVSKRHPRLPMHSRAAQFAPFAALVGYDDAVAETARVTEKRPELDEQQQQILNAQMCRLAEHLNEMPLVRIKYFVPDARKHGGAVVEICGAVRQIAASEGNIVLNDGKKIPVKEIIDLSFI